MDFSNLSTLQQRAKEFMSKVNRLDAIIHNAGVMLPDNPDETTAQGWYQQLGINALAPFLLQLFLNPLVLHTASAHHTTQLRLRKEAERYGQSKAMNCMFAYEFARRYKGKGSGIGLQKNAPGWFKLLFGILRKEARFGALTVLWADIREMEDQMQIYLA
ncbi:hypothetical protein BGZ57DRAFT_853083 [Hyaloscypha finlandica]|nr:hypothetical protein BGZ57DRAFT_853083 [Hyaloscypha finlandica]